MAVTAVFRWVCMLMPVFNLLSSSRPKYSYGYGDATNHGFRDDYGQALKGGSHSYYNGGHRPTAHY